MGSTRRVMLVLACGLLAGVAVAAGGTSGSTTRESLRIASPPAKQAKLDSHLARPLARGAPPQLVRVELHATTRSGSSASP